MHALAASLAGSSSQRIAKGALYVIARSLSSSAGSSMAAAPVGGSSADRPAALGISEELAQRVKDQGLLRREGYIGGDWVKASDGGTYQVWRWGWRESSAPSCATRDVCVSPRRAALHARRRCRGESRERAASLSAPAASDRPPSLHHHQNQPTNQQNRSTTPRPGGPSRRSRATAATRRSRRLQRRTRCSRRGRRSPPRSAARRCAGGEQRGWRG